MNFILSLVSSHRSNISDRKPKQVCTKEPNMKEDCHHLHKHQRRLLIISKLFTTPAAYVILFLLAYALGYLSAPFTRSPPSSPRTITVFQQLPNSRQRQELSNFRVTTRCADPLPSRLVRETILERIFNGTSPYDNFPPPYVVDLLRNNRIKGWGSYGAVFEHLIEEVKPRIIIEVGTFLGASALHMTELTRKLGLETQIFCIDDFRGWPGFRDKLFKDIKMVNGDVLLLYQFMQNVIHKNATNTVLPVPFSTGSALEKLCEWGVFGDLIEVDAGHDFNSAWADINRAYRILKPGGVMFGHDYFTAADNRGVRRAVNLFAQINGFGIQTDGQHWVIRSS